MHHLFIKTEQDIEDQSPDEWRWLGHRVITADGTTITMSDTAENQAEYPQQRAFGIVQFTKRNRPSGFRLACKMNQCLFN